MHHSDRVLRRTLRWPFCTSSLLLILIFARQTPHRPLRRSVRHLMSNSPRWTSIFGGSSSFGAGRSSQSKSAHCVEGGHFGRRNLPSLPRVVGMASIIAWTRALIRLSFRSPGGRRTLGTLSSLPRRRSSLRCAGRRSGAGTTRVVIDHVLLAAVGRLAEDDRCSTSSPRASCRG